MTLHLDRRRLRICALGLALVPLLALPSYAEDGPALRVVRVEEDWELQVDQPDVNSNGPQVSCTLSPTGDLSGVYAVFELNHRSLPSFSAGGMQLQIWSGETPVSSRKHPNDSLLNTSGEVIRWTQRLTLVDDWLIFDIDDGSSTTWGSFGGWGYMWYATPTDLDSLHTYDPEVSVTHSGVGYASNRVRYLAMRRLRIVLSDGTTIEDDTTRVAHAVN